jgi:hypothetical protein
MQRYFLIFGMTLGMILGIFLFFNAGVLKAAEEPAATIDEDLEYTYGSVVSSSAAEVVVTEYNYETDEEIQTPYTVSAETKFSNVGSAPDLVKGDNVDIYYKNIDEKKVATMITKDETVYESQPEEENLPGDVPTNSIEPSSNSTSDVPTPAGGNETTG